MRSIRCNTRLLSSCFDFKEHIYTKVWQTSYMAAGSAGRHVVGFGALDLDVVWEVQSIKLLSIVFNILYRFYAIEFKGPRKGAEALCPKMLT